MSRRGTCAATGSAPKVYTIVRWRMTLYTLGPDETKDGPFADVHAQNELEARKKVQSVDNRRNWFDLGAVYCVPIERIATPYFAGEVRIFEKLVDLPPA